MRTNPATTNASRAGAARAERAAPCGRRPQSAPRAQARSQRRAARSTAVGAASRSASADRSRRQIAERSLQKRPEKDAQGSPRRPARESRRAANREPVKSVARSRSRRPDGCRTRRRREHSSREADAPLRSPASDDSRARCGEPHRRAGDDDQPERGELGDHERKDLRRTEDDSPEPRSAGLGVHSSEFSDHHSGSRIGIAVGAVERRRPGAEESGRSAAFRSTGIMSGPRRWPKIPAAQLDSPNSPRRSARTPGPARTNGTGSPEWMTSGEAGVRDRR